MSEELSPESTASEERILRPAVAGELYMLASTLKRLSLANAGLSLAVFENDREEVLAAMRKFQEVGHEIEGLLNDLLERQS